MERIIVIRESKNQKKTTIKSNATTLGELKKELDVAGINYKNMAFYEGITKSEFTRDDAQLPHDVMYKGVTTNNLVFLLTQTNKKIESGMMSRKEMYEFIKANNLNDVVKQIYGDSMTRVSSINLSQFIDNYIKKESYKKVDNVDIDTDVKENVNTNEVFTDNNTPVKYCGTKEEILDLKFEELSVSEKIKVLYEITKSNYEINEFEKALSKAFKKINEKKVESPFSDEELEAIFA